MGRPLILEDWSIDELVSDPGWGQRDTFCEGTKYRKTKNKRLKGGPKKGGLMSWGNEKKPKSPRGGGACRRPRPRGKAEGLQYRDGKGRVR